MTPDRLSPIADWLLRRLTPAHWRESIEGDLLEERARRRVLGRRAGPWWEAWAALIVGARLAFDVRAATIASVHQHATEGNRGHRSLSRIIPMILFSSIWRHAYRSLLATPLVTILAVVSLALGIGANTALFSIFNTLLLKTLPVQEPERLAYLRGGSWTYAIWEAVQAREDELFDGAFAWSGERFDMARSGETDDVEGAYVSGRMFDLLGIRASRGRLLQAADDDRTRASAVAAISHRFWQQHFSGAPDVVGRTVLLDKVPFTVVGVMPAGFFGPDVGRASDVMVPFAAETIIRGKESALNGRSTWWLDIMVRMKRGQSVEQATTVLRAAQPQIRNAALPDWNAEMLARFLNQPFTLQPAANGRSQLRGDFEMPLLAMIGAVALVLLIACANIANLLLARALSRRREMSVRLALGASRWQVAQLLLAESLMIAAAGAGLGLVFARWSSALLVSQFGTWRDTVFLDLTLDWRVLAFTAALTIVTALVAGVAPALGVKQVNPNDALKDSGRGIAGERHFGLRATLVVAQIALSLLLVVGAGLFLRTFSKLTSMPLGFSPDSLVVVDLTLPRVQSDPSDYTALTERFRAAAAAVPGVTRAGISAITPVSGRGWNGGVGEFKGFPDRSKMTWLNATTPEWFATMGMRMVAGRDFAATDRRGGELVAVVNQTFAGKYFPGQQVVGQPVILSGPSGGTRYTIVGLVADAVYRSPREGMVPTFYTPLSQRDSFFSGGSLTVATLPGRRAEVQRALAAALSGVDASASFTFRTYDQYLAATVTQERLVAMLSSFFGGLALLLAGIGIYGVVSHSVGRRRQEIGIRMALGSDAAGIVRLVFGRVAVMLGAGVAVGLGLSLWTSRFVKTLLFQLEANDPITLVSATAVLIVVGTLAAWIPARRAARLDPAAVLRESN